jgi:hypothetical protein
MHARTGIAVALLTLSVVTCGVEGTGVQAPDTSTLGPTVDAFVREWSRGDVDAAASRIARSTQQNPAVLPQVRGETAQGDGRQALANDLRELRAQLWQDSAPDAVWASTTIESLPDLGNVATKRGVRFQRVPNPPVLVFPVGKRDDIAWCGSLGPRHDVLFENATFTAFPRYGVVGRLLASNKVAIPILFLWTFEPGFSVDKSWRLVTLFPVMTK